MISLAWDMYHHFSTVLIIISFIFQISITFLSLPPSVRCFPSCPLEPARRFRSHFGCASLIAFNLFTYDNFLSRSTYLYLSTCLSVYLSFSNKAWQFLVWAGFCFSRSILMCPPFSLVLHSTPFTFLISWLLFNVWPISSLLSPSDST